jgi:DNA-binding CsgD family transcriptional regulator
MLQRDRETSLDAVPMPDSLSELVGRHVTQLPESTRICLAAASALSRPSLRQLRDLGVADSLDAAERAGLIRIDGHDVAFTHPLYAAAAYDGLGAGERMRLHTRLADVVQGEEERARHLALGADEADEAVATALDVARDRALSRGASDAALDACQLGLRATPASSPLLTGRRIRFGNLLFRAGETDRARHELTSAAESAANPLDRARALHALARVVNDTEGGAGATPLELQALVLAGDDVDLTADIHMGLAISNDDDWTVAVAHARIAVDLLEHDPSQDPRRMAEALSAQLGPAFYAGEGADLDMCRRAIDLQAGEVSVPISDRAVSVLFYLQLWTDDFAAAREQMDLVYQLCVDEGDEASRCYVLACRAQLEVRSGLWVEAERLIQECIDLAQTSQNTFYVRTMSTQRAWLAAYRGDLDTARITAEEDIERGAAAGIGVLEQRGRGLRGYCALVRDDVRAATEDLERYHELFETNNAAEPALRQLEGDRVEALVAAGRMADAERALAEMVEPATRLNRTAVLAAAARAEALLRAEQGDAAASIAAAQRSLDLYDRIERRLDRARAQLAKGQIHRRFKQKSLARQELTAALKAFEDLGAAGFAERSRAELARVGLRPPAAQGLTETERRIAGLTAKGMTSAEIGNSLFLSTKTVSSNLTRIYRKLGVRNRAELAAALNTGGESDISASSTG